MAKYLPPPPDPGRSAILINVVGEMTSAVTEGVTGYWDPALVCQAEAPPDMNLSFIAGEKLRNKRQMHIVVEYGR